MWIRHSCLWLAPLILLAGCGYIGEPLTPALNIPVRIDNLQALQRGDQVIIDFIVPQMTTEGLLLKGLGQIELRAGPAGAPPFDLAGWLAGAGRIEVPKPEFGPVHIELPTAPWVGREIILAVRTSSPKGRVSEWSNLVVVSVVEPLMPPAELRAEAVSEGVKLSWQIAPERPGAAVRIHRKGPADQRFSQVARVEGSAWIDTATEYGKKYEYKVQTVFKAGAGEAESERMPLIAIVPVDRFPPAIPSGLAAVASTDGIELTWERNTEADLAGYRVYRAAGDGEFQRISDLFPAPAYSDRRVESGKRYRYAVAAVDLLDNQSPLSPPVEINVP